MVVETCLSNVDAEERARLAADSVDLTVHPCLEQCGICYTGTFLVVDGELEIGPDHETILEGYAEE